MKSSIPPQIGERFFLYHREVVVTQTYVVFHLVKIKYLGESNEFYIDYHALTSKPSYVNSIGINKLRGESQHEHDRLSPLVGTGFESL